MSIPPLSPIEPVPSRSTAANNAQFTFQVDNFFTSFPVMRTELNERFLLINVAVTAATDAAASAAISAAAAQAAAALGVSFTKATRTQLLTIVGEYDAQGAGVYNDAGTHTDPVSAETGVPNQGIYSWSAADSAWVWVGSGTGGAVDWNDLTGKPSTFAPSAHTHSIGEVTGLETALAGKAPLASPEFSGNPTAPTQAPGNNTTRIATTAFVTAAIAALGGGGEMVYPAAGIAVSTGTGWAGSLAIPSGSLVGTTASQTLTNKTLGSGTTISAGDLRAGVGVVDTGTVSMNSPGRRGLVPITATNRTAQAADMGKRIRLNGTLTIPNTLPDGWWCLVDNVTGSNRSVTTSGGATLRYKTAVGGQAILPHGTVGVWKESGSEHKIAGDVA